MTHQPSLTPAVRFETPFNGDAVAPLSRLEIPAAFAPLFQPARYKVFYGGRGGAKSRSLAGAAVLLAAQRPRRILCAREFQTSIQDSVYELIKGQIERQGLKSRFRIGRTYIEGKNGSEFIFHGLRIDPDKIKSMEGIDICWTEEAQRVSEASWTYLIPTIRNPGSEIWASFNPEGGDDPTYRRFIVNPPPDAIVVKVNWDSNPWFPEELNRERLHCLATDPDAYNWIWDGNVRQVSDAQIFKGKFEIEAFETPKDARFYLGADWGFGADPTTLVRAYEKDGCLWIDFESYAHNLDLDKIGQLWRKQVPGCDKWPIYGDNSQPQTIAHVKKQGLSVKPAKKWNRSVEEGIRYLRGYRRIVIHERCVHTAQEFKLYSYKTDRVTDEVLPIVVDKHNHCIDALRYALDKRIRRKGGVF